MTTDEQSITDIVLDKSVCIKFAKMKAGYLKPYQDELLIYLAGNSIVHSELNLKPDHSLILSNCRGDLSELEMVLQQENVPFLKTGKDGEEIVVTIASLQVRMSAGRSINSITMYVGRRQQSLHIIPESMVRLLQFLESVFPYACEKVEKTVIGLAREEMIASMAASIVTETIKAMGLKHNVIVGEMIL